jgi:flagellin-like protein
MATRTRRGISSIIGTLLVLAITVTAGALLYMYSQGLFNNVTHKATVPINVQMYVENPHLALINFEIQNPTNEPITIQGIWVANDTSNDGFFSANVVVPPGQSISITRQIIGSNYYYSLGNEYFVTFYGSIGNQAFSDTVDVIAQGWQG